MSRVKIKIAFLKALKISTFALELEYRDATCFQNNRDGPTQRGTLRFPPARRNKASQNVMIKDNIIPTKLGQWLQRTFKNGQLIM